MKMLVRYSTILKLARNVSTLSVCLAACQSARGQASYPLDLPQHYSGRVTPVAVLGGIESGVPQTQSPAPRLMQAPTHTPHPPQIQTQFQAPLQAAPVPSSPTPNQAAELRRATRPGQPHPPHHEQHQSPEYLQAMEPQLASIDHILQTPIMRRLLELMQENVELKANMRVHEIEMRTSRELTELRSTIERLVDENASLKRSLEESREVQQDLTNEKEEALQRLKQLNVELERSLQGRSQSEHQTRALEAKLREFDRQLAERERELAEQTRHRNDDKEDDKKESNKKENNKKEQDKHERDNDR